MARYNKGEVTGQPQTEIIPLPAGGVQMQSFIPWKLIKRGVHREVITPIDAPQAFEREVAQALRQQSALKDTPLVRALGLAHYWQRLLESGRYASLTEIAAAEGLDRAQVNRIAGLARLAPEIVWAVMAGRTDLALARLAKAGQAASWAEQVKAAGVNAGGLPGTAA